MKVEITGLATLEITPENAIENYALRKWSDDYSVVTNGNHESCFKINILNEGWKDC